MEFEQFKEYIDKVKNHEKFKELDEFTRMTRIKGNQDIYENIRDYIKIYHPVHDEIEYFQPDYEYFIKFVESYLNNKPSEISLGDDGYIDLSRTLFLVQPPMFSGNQGNFLDKYMIMTDGSVYISKLPLNYRGNSGVSNKYCLYCPLIASYIAKSLGVSSADIALAHIHNGSRILSKNFLIGNEEIVVYTEDNQTISQQLEKITESLKLRKFDESEIEQVKIEFLKQEFVSKLIGLKDQTADNSPFIVSIDEYGNRHVKMAPMFDLDYCFHIAENIDMIVRKCDNGKEDIGSFIEQYINYPGFEEFLANSLESFDITKVFKQIYEDTGIRDIETYSGNEQMKEFVKFVNKNIEIARNSFDKLHNRERDER